MEKTDEKNKLYCRNCGSEITKNADFCEVCGSPKESREIKYVKSRGGGNSVGKAIAIIFGGFFILIAIPILFGGGALMGVTDIFDQGGGYIGVNHIDLQTSTQMLVVKEMEIHIDDFDNTNNLRRSSIPASIWEPSVGDLVTIKIKAESNTGDDVFIGIIKASDGYDVLGNYAYEQITQYRMEDTRERYPTIEYRYHPGDTLELMPSDLNIWVEQVNGSGEQTLTWSPEIGDYWVVIMNADGSSNVNIDTGVALRMPILGFIGKGLFLGGFVLLAFGVAIVYFGAIRPR